MTDELQELKIQVKIDAETGKIEILDTKLSGLEKTTDKIQNATQKTTNENKKFAHSLRVLSDAIGVNISIATGWIGVLLTITKVLKDSLSNAEKEIERQKQLKLVIESTGQSYEKLSGQINSTIDSLASISKYTKDELTDAFIRTMKLQGDTSAGFKLLKIAMDVAAGTGKDVNEVLEMFSGALVNSERGLKMLAREYGKLIGDAKTGTEAIENLGKQFAGATEKQATLGKTTSSLKQTYDDLTKTIGDLLLPVLKSLMQVALVPLTGLLTSLTIAFALLRTGIDNVILSFKVLKSIATLNVKDIGKAWKEYTESMKNNWSETINSIDNAGRRMMNAFNTETKKVSIDMQTQLNTVMDDVEEKAKNKTDEINQKVQQAVEETTASLQEQAKQIDGIVNIVSSNIDNAFGKILETGQITQEELGKVFENILKDFVRMLERMIVEMMARAVIMSLLNVFTGGAAGGVGAVLGAFQTGGTVPETGRYILHKGEKVIPPGANISNSNSSEINVNIGINAMDIRQIDRIQIERIVSQLRPYLRKELKKYD